MFRSSKKDKQEAEKKRTSKLRAVVSEASLPQLADRSTQSSELARGMWGEKKLSLPPILDDQTPAVKPFKRSLEDNDTLIQFAAMTSVHMKPYPAIKKGDVITLRYMKPVATGAIHKTGAVHKTGTEDKTKAVHISINQDNEITYLPTYVLDHVLPVNHIDNVYLTSIVYLKQSPGLVKHLIYGHSKPPITPCLLAKLFIARGEFAWLLQLMAEYECENLKGGNTLFRNTDSSPLLSIIINLISPKHNSQIKTFVDGLVRNLRKENNRQHDGQSAIHLAKHCIEYLSLKLNVTSSGIVGMGVSDELIYILKLLRTVLESRYNEEETTQILGGILMLRIINPVLVEDKALLSVVKKLQQLSNQVIVDEGDGLLCQQMRELFCKLCMVNCKVEPFSCDKEVDREARFLYDVLLDLKATCPEDQQNIITQMISQIGSHDLVSEKMQEVRRIFPIASLSPRVGQ